MITGPTYCAVYDVSGSGPEYVCILGGWIGAEPVGLTAATPREIRLTSEANLRGATLRVYFDHENKADVFDHRDEEIRRCINA